jgi:hypothetical protein
MERKIANRHRKLTGVICIVHETVLKSTPLMEELG